MSVSAWRLAVMMLRSGLREREKWRGGDMTNSGLRWERERQREERLVEERISKIMQRTKQGGKTEIRWWM